MKHTKHIFSLLLVLFVSQTAFTQEWLQKLEQLKNSGKELTFYQIRDAFNEYWTPYQVKNGTYIKDGVEVKAPGWKIFKRWEWYWEPRIDLSTGNFPQTTTAEQWEKYKSSGKFSQLKSSSGSWKSLGPVSSDGGYVGIGRINCIAFHPSDPNTYWVGSPSGGLWKTSDNGSTWEVLTDNNDVLGVSDIAIPSDYATSNTLYIATGDRDGGSSHTLGGGNPGDNNTIGILKSNDGGATWAPSKSFNVDSRYLSGFLRIHPTNNSILYAGIANVIFKTTNGGASWSQQNVVGSLNGIFLIDMEFHPANPDTMYVATKSSPPRIFRTLDGGTNWSEISLSLTTSDRRIELAVSPAAPSTVYAVVSNTNGGLTGIYKSTNNGYTFTKVFDGTLAGHNLLGYYSDGSGDNKGQGYYDLALTVSPTNANVLYLGGINTWKSTNGGTTWTIANMWTSSSTYNKVNPKAPKVHADKHALKFQDETTLFEGNDGGIYKTTDGGSTWTDLTNGMTISQIYRLGVSATSLNNVITGLQDNGTKLLYDNDWYDVKGGDGMECLIDYTDQNIQYGSYVNGQISRTTNLWNNTTDINENIGDGTLEGHWVTPYIIDPVDHNTIYVGYQDVWKSTDKGDTFVKISTMNTTNDLRSMAIAPSDNQVMYVADPSHIWTTKDGGTTWSDVTGSLSTGNAITYLAVHAYDPNTVWATFGGYTGSQVFESTDGGTTWTDISSGLPSLPAFCIIQNKQALTKNHLYVGTDRGVYFKDGDENWTLFNSGLPNVMVTELEIYYNKENSDSSVLFASTYGRGLWKSDLKEIPVPVLDAEITEVTYPENKNYCGVTGFSPTIKVKNNGSSTITSLTASYNLDEGTEVTTTWTGSLATGEFATIAFPEINPTIGSYVFNTSLTAINGGADEISFNNSESVSFYVVDNNFSFPFTEGFNASIIPGCWTQEVVTDNGNTAPQISFVTLGVNPIQVPYEGSHMVMFNSYDCETGSQARLISPAFSTLEKSAITVSFEWNENAANSNYLDSVTIQWSTDGSSWNNGETYVRYNNANPGWVSKSYVLPAGAENQATLYVAFLFTSEYGDNCYLDDLEITAVAPVVFSITTGNINNSPYTVSDLAGASISVPFTSSGTYSSNVYTAYLSDASGSFTSETAIGTLTSDANTDTIQGTIPANTPSGTGYKIRVKSSNPVVEGSESNAFEIRLTTTSITTGTISGDPYNITDFAGTSISVPFTSTGIFASNTYTAYLSGASGSFASETAIGSLTSDANSGTISGNIPANTPSGTGYKIRVKSSNPAIIGSESNAFEIILTNNTIEIGTIGGSPFVVSNIMDAIVSIPYTTTGIYTSNTFTTYLSDESGSFSNETAIGTLNSNTEGTIIGLIPASTPDGNAYKIRIKSSNPSLISNESENLTVVLDSIKPTVTLTSTVDDSTNVSPIELLVNFSEPVTDFDLSRISVNNGTKDNFIILSDTGFSFKLSPVTDGVVSAQVAANVVQDAVGNYNIASEIWSTTYLQALGIEELSKEGIQVYPNPVERILTFKFNTVQKDVKLKVLGLDGKLYLSKEFLNTDQYQLDFSEIANGIYIIQLLIEKKLLNVKIIKQ